jgi:hypothetical protein
MSHKHLATLLFAVSVLVSSITTSNAAGLIAQSRKLDQNVSVMLKKTHGFHCRVEFGWNPLTGYYQLHRHEGICRDFNRCLGVHRKCIRIYARGWNTWEYEKWGWDNWKYTNCMVKYECY